MDELSSKELEEAVYKAQKRLDQEKVRERRKFALGCFVMTLIFLAIFFTASCSLMNHIMGEY